MPRTYSSADGQRPESGPTQCAPEVEYLRQHLVVITVGDTVSAGILLDEAKGFVLTCHHVICDSRPNDIYVARSRREESVRAEDVVADFPREDISILRVRFPGPYRIPIVALDPSPLEIKQKTWMIGSARVSELPEGNVVKATTHAGLAVQRVRFPPCSCLKRSGLSWVDLDSVELPNAVVNKGMSGGPAVRTGARRLCAMVEGRGERVDMLDGDGIDRGLRREVLHDPVGYLIPISAVYDCCVDQKKWLDLKEYVRRDEDILKELREEVEAAKSLADLGKVRVKTAAFLDEKPHHPDGLILKDEITKARCMLTLRPIRQRVLAAGSVQEIRLAKHELDTHLVEHRDCAEGRSLLDQVLAALRQEEVRAARLQLHLVRLARSRAVGAILGVILVVAVLVVGFSFRDELSGLWAGVSDRPEQTAPGVKSADLNGIDLRQCTLKSPCEISMLGPNLPLSIELQARGYAAIYVVDEFGGTFPQPPRIANGTEASIAVAFGGRGRFQLLVVTSDREMPAEGSTNGLPGVEQLRAHVRVR